MTTAVEIGGGGEQMYLRHGSFWWPWLCTDAIWSASPDAAWPGLHQKPLNATIGQLLAPYHPGGHQGDNQNNDYAKCTHFAGRFDGHRVAPVLYRAHRPMEEVHGFHGSHYTPPPGKHSLRYYKRDMPTPVVLDISSWKRARVDMLAPNNNRGMTYQTDEKHLNNMSEYFVGVVNTAFNCYNNRFLWRVINQ